jgi:apolipoprotein N-acyltransferase
MNRLRTLRWLAASLALGGASALGFAPLGWWPVTLFAFAGWMVLVADAPSLKSAFARGYWFGVGHFVVGLNWIAGAFRYQEAMPVWLGWVAVVLLALYIAVYPALAAAVAWQFGVIPPHHGEGNRAKRGGGVASDTTSSSDCAPDANQPHHRFAVPLSMMGRHSAAYILIFAAAWIVTEWMRSWMFTGFAWNSLGVALVPAGALPQASAIIGTYGISAILILISGGLIQLAQRNWRWSVLLLVPLVFVGFPKSIPVTEPGDRRPLIRIVQPNIGQNNKYDEGYRRINFAKLTSLTGKPGPEPRLIFWPEAAIPDYLEEDDIESKIARARVAALLGPKDVLLLGGVVRHFKRIESDGYYEEELVGARNNVWGFDSAGKLLWRYDKSHLVPYGEYLPAKPILSAIGLTRLVPGTVDFWPGPGPQSFAVPGFGKAGVQICYEIIFSGQVIDPKNRPDFLFNPSNDAWFGSWGPPQHLAQARLRAIEEGIPIIRSTPTGISAVIDANGVVRKSLPYQTAGFIETRLPPAHAPTLFARYGNMLPLLFALLLFGAGVALKRNRR